jgi:hypothetical protein
LHPVDDSFLFAQRLYLLEASSTTGFFFFLMVDQGGFHRGQPIIQGDRNPRRRQLLKKIVAKNRAHDGRIESAVDAPKAA